MSKRTDWQTPLSLFSPLQALIGFEVDAAADGENHLLPTWYGPGSPLGEDALTIPVWLSPAWCNPPYGRGIEKWLDKFIEQAKLGGKVVALLPANTEVRWWYEKVVPFADIMFLVGRVPFSYPNMTKPTQPDHPSALCVFEEDSQGRVMWLDWKETFKVDPTQVRETE